MDLKKALRKYRLIGFVWDVGELYFEKRVSRSAAELAYFLILSVFPTLIWVNAVVGMMDLEIGALLAQAGNLIPTGVRLVVEEYLGYIGGDRPGLLTAGVLMTVWSSSAAFRALMNVMADIWGKRRLRGIKQIAVSLLYSALLLAAVYVSGVVLLTGEWFFRGLEKRLPCSLPDTNWSWLRFLILFCLMLALILVIYRLSAPRSGLRPPVFTGALLAAAALVAASALFSWFIGMSSRYSLVYGSLASVIILLVWLYLCGNMLILGNVFNCVWYRHKRERGEIR